MNLADMKIFEFAKKRGKNRKRLGHGEYNKKRIKLKQAKKQQNKDGKIQKLISADFSTVNSLTKLNLCEEITTPHLTRLIVWLRNDLRLHDNYVLNWAMQYKLADNEEEMIETKKEILIVYCFDEGVYN